jgi:hypothetical protein
MSDKSRSMPERKPHALDEKANGFEAKSSPTMTWLRMLLEIRTTDEVFL